MDKQKQTVGRAKTVLVFGQGDRQKAVISEIVVRTTRTAGDDGHLHFGGNVLFSDSTKNHIREIILPITNNITNSLGLPLKDFEISAVNLGAASSFDIGMNVSGFSADVPVFLGMLSAGLQMPLSNDFVATGHIASVEGDIGSVRAIPAKLEAVKADKSITRFIHPDFERDISLTVLTPIERQLSIRAVMSAKDSVRTEAVDGIGELTRVVFTEQEIVLASLREGFFGISNMQDRFNNPVHDCVSFLTKSNEKRFWEILKRHFLAGRCDRAKELLQAFARFHIACQLYPANVGTMLEGLICSLPPAVRRIKTCFPILETKKCVQLSSLAKERDIEDVPVLFNVACGRHLKGTSELKTPKQPCTATKITDLDCKAFDDVAGLINEQAFAQKYGIAIDSARGSFILSSATVDSQDEFIDTIMAFYVHLKHHINPSPVGPIKMEHFRKDAIALLERAFQNKGGLQAAYVSAREGIRGGMRLVLDDITEQLKGEEREEYIKRVFTDAINGFDWEERVNFMRGAMQRLLPFLPEDIRNEPPERFAKNYEVIVRVYVKSIDEVSQLLHTI